MVDCVNGLVSHLINGNTVCNPIWSMYAWICTNSSQWQVDSSSSDSVVNIHSLVSDNLIL